MAIKKVNIKENEIMEVKISKDIKLIIHKLNNKSAFVEINHYDTCPSKKVKLDNYSSFSTHENASWSICGSSFRSYEGTAVTVNHRAYIK